MKKASPMTTAGVARRRLMIIAFVFLVAGVGSYVVFKANAACYPGSPGDIQIGDCPKTQYNYQAGQTVVLPVSAYVPDPRQGQYPSQTLHLTIEFSSNDGAGIYTNRTSYQNYSCGSAGSCQNMSPGSGADFKLCININQAHFGQSGVNLLSATYRSNFHGRWWVGADYSWKSGTCGNVSGFLSTGGSVGTTLGQCGTVSDVCENAGPQGPTGPPGPPGGDNPGDQPGSDTGNDDQGDNPGEQQGGSGGSSGGSSANRQSDRQNPIPVSSEQGSQDNQPDLEPTPFFDGKQYAPGSLQDTLAKTTSGVKAKVVKYWPVLIGILLLLGVLGWMAWKNYKQKSAK